MHFDLYKMSAKSEETGSKSALSHSTPTESGSDHPIVVEGNAPPQAETVKTLLALLRQHQEALNKQDALSPYFTGDILKVAEKCWEQIHGNIGEAIEAKYQKIFDEFGALVKLSQLDQLKQEHNSSQPAWRPSGIPREDFDAAAGAEARVALVPRFEEKYLEVQQLSQERQKVIEEKQQKIKDLEAEIRTRLGQLDTVPLKSRTA